MDDTDSIAIRVYRKMELPTLRHSPLIQRESFEHVVIYLLTVVPNRHIGTTSCCDVDKVNRYCAAVNQLVARPSKLNYHDVKGVVEQILLECFHGISRRIKELVTVEQVL